MDIKLFQRLLAARFARTKTTDANGAVVRTLAKPASLSPFLERTLNTEEERELYGGSFEAWPGNVHELLDEQSDDLRQGLVVFSWDGWGPVSSAAGFETIDIGGSSQPRWRCSLCRGRIQHLPRRHYRSGLVWVGPELNQTNVSLA
jgi:hypothetical protein